MNDPRQTELEQQIELEKKLAEMFPEGLDVKLGEVKVLIEDNTDPPSKE